MQKLLRARRRLTCGEREQIVEAYRRSSLSQERFAAQAGISVSALQLWLRQGAVPKAVAPRLIQLPNPLATLPCLPEALSERVKGMESRFATAVGAALAVLEVDHDLPR